MTQIVVSASIFGDHLMVGNMIFVPLSFLLLVLLVKKFAYEPVMKMMENRANKISDDLDSAARDKEESKKKTEELNERLANSEKTVREVMSRAESTAKKRADQIVEEAQDYAAKLKSATQEEIEETKKRAMKESQDDIVDISFNIAEKIIGTNLSQADQDQLINACIQELGEKYGA